MARLSSTTNTSFTKSKARKVLREDMPTLKGKAITKKQRGLLGLIAGGGVVNKLKGQLSAIKRKIK